MRRPAARRPDAEGRAAGAGARAAAPRVRLVQPDDARRRTPRCSSRAATGWSGSARSTCSRTRTTSSASRGSRPFPAPSRSLESVRPDAGLVAMAARVVDVANRRARAAAPRWREPDVGPRGAGTRRRARDRPAGRGQPEDVDVVRAGRAGTTVVTRIAAGVALVPAAPAVVAPPAGRCGSARAGSAVDRVGHQRRHAEPGRRPDQERRPVGAHPPGAAEIGRREQPEPVGRRQPRALDDGEPRRAGARDRRMRPLIEAASTCGTGSTTARGDGRGRRRPGRSPSRPRSWCRRQPVASAADEVTAAVG